jgi:hypothetical protein
MERAGQEHEAAHASQRSHQQYILQQAYFWEAADALEHLSADENPLVTIRPPPPRSQGIAALQQTIEHTRGLDPLAERAGDYASIIHCRGDLSDPVLRQPSVGVQKQEHVAACVPCANVLLDAPAARGRDGPTVRRGGDLERGVLAPAIDDDHLITTRPPSSLDRRGDIRRFVERGDDDRDAHGHTVM